ncbi:DUF4394 domain-containing protein [Kitasatospora sp. NPDC088346]|uniref:DUF4394 domain-containing protein n=1 Tax=Kitasatospora sp. NPDC088346 TaxID=3364073 RepID=UPI0037FDE4D4
MRRGALTGAIVLALGAALLGGAGPSVADGHGYGHFDRRGLAVIGLTDDQRLVEFRTGDVESAAPLGRVSGLTGDTRLVGIDFRAQNGELYGVGDKGGVYTLDIDTAAASKVSQLTVALQGTRFGVDFDPAADRLRIISDTGQNLRHNLDDPQGPPAAGTTAVDGTLALPAVPPATTGATATGVTGAAYTNNDLDAATGSTLFDIDTALDRVSLQSPADTGSLAPTGSLGAAAEAGAGFDIYFSPIHHSNTAYASLQVDGARRFFRIDLLTGAALRLGSFPVARQVTDIALPLAQDDDQD